MITEENAKLKSENAQLAIKLKKQLQEELEEIKAAKYDPDAEADFYELLIAFGDKEIPKHMMEALKQNLNRYKYTMEGHMRFGKKGAD